MFARTAKVLAFERLHPVRAPVGQAFEVREADRLNAALRRLRPVLLCRWQLDPASGRPVCAWDVESPELAPSPEIDPSWAIPEQQLLCIAVVAHRAAAPGAFRATRGT
jgi:hypothetical protein